MNTEFTKIASVFAIGVMLAAGFSVSAFVYPDTAPPGYSATSPVYAPLTVGAVEDGLVVGQSKLGGLALCTGWTVDVNCIVSGGVIYSKGDLELETGIIRGLNGNITFDAAAGITIPSVSDIAAVGGAPNGTVLYSTDDNKFNFRVDGVWVQFPSP